MKGFQSAIITTGLLLLCDPASGQQPPPQTMRLDIEPKSLEAALNQLAAQTGLQVIVRTDELPADIKAPRLAGTYTARAALEELLEPSGLEYEFVNARTVNISGAPTADQVAPTESKESDASPKKESSSENPESPTPSPSTTSASADSSQRGAERTDTVVVTGTRIRGVAPDSAPITIYDRADIEESGAATLAQFARKIPQNFASADPALSGRNPAGFIQSGGNQSRGSGFNLRGLGPGATLTLVNGHRLAPSGSDGQFVDISLIPLSVIDRIEVLTDGASAIYGADAIAGVVNIVLREDFEGAETGLRFGSTWGGGATERTASQLLGASWSSGDAMLVYEYGNRDPLFATDRSFIPPQAGPVTLIPEEERHNVLLRGQQHVLADTTIGADVFFSERDFALDSTLLLGAPLLASSAGTADQRGATLGIRTALVGDWDADLTSSYSTHEESIVTSRPSTSAPGAPTLTQRLAAETDHVAVDLIADGPLFSLGGGRVKAAVGAGFRTEDFRDRTSAMQGTNPLPGSANDLKRRVTSAYAEIFLPLIGEENSARGVRRLELSVAGRYDHYDDFGSSTNPRAGLLWSPVSWLNIRGTYATSFRPPLLPELINRPAYVVFNFSDPRVSDGVRTTLTDQGRGNPDLHAAESRSVSAGFDVKLESVPELSIAATYFRIHFDDRVSRAPVVGSIFTLYTVQADRLAPFINYSPDPAFVAAAFASGTVTDLSGRGAAGVEAFFDVRPQNIALSRESGIDLSASYGRSTNYGDLSFSVAGTYLLENEYRSVETVPEVSLLNLIGQPLDFRARGVFGWSRGDFWSSLSLNYLTAYENTLFTPQREVGSWKTADLQLGYRTGEQRYSVLGNLTLAISLQNVTDEQPPAVDEPPPARPFGYDPANASPVGRSVSVALTKRW